MNWTMMSWSSGFTEQKSFQRTNLLQSFAQSAQKHNTQQVIVPNSSQQCRILVALGWWLHIFSITIGIYSVFPLSMPWEVTNIGRSLTPDPGEQEFTIYHYIWRIHTMILCCIYLKNNLWWTGQASQNKSQTHWIIVSFPFINCSSFKLFTVIYSNY